MDLIERPVPAHEVRTGDRLALNQQLVTDVVARGLYLMFMHARGHTLAEVGSVVRVQRWARLDSQGHPARVAWDAS